MFEKLASTLCAPVLFLGLVIANTIHLAIVFYMRGRKIGDYEIAFDRWFTFAVIIGLALIMFNGFGALFMTIAFVLLTLLYMVLAALAINIIFVVIKITFNFCKNIVQEIARAFKSTSALHIAYKLFLPVFFVVETFSPELKEKRLKANKQQNEVTSHSK